MTTVHPESYNVMIREGQQHPAHIPQHRNSSCTPKKRSIVSIVIVSVVFAGIVCAIVIPLVLNGNRAKNDDPPPSSTTTTTTTSSWSSTTDATENSSETNTSLTSIKPTTITKTQSIVTTRSSTKNTDMNTTDNDDNDTDPSTVIPHTSTDLTSTSSIRTHSTTTTSMTSTLTTTEKSSTILSTQSTSTRSRLDRIRVNYFNDTIFGVYNTIAGGLIGGFSNDVPKQTAEYAMDGLLQTKYYNPRGTSRADQGLNTGFIVIPLARQHTVVCALCFGTGKDVSERDPFTVTLEGSNGTDIGQLNSILTWTLIYNGSTGINNTEILNRSTYASEQYFGNEHAFISYRLLVTSKRNNSDAVQYSEAHIYNCP